MAVRDDLDSPALTPIVRVTTAAEAPPDARIENPGDEPVEALAAGTRVAAAALWCDETIGTLEPSRYADLGALGGDPTRDVRALRGPRLVVTGR